MDLLGRIDRYVARPDDSETQRTQKTLAVILLFVSSTSTLINGWRYYNVGLDGVALMFFILGAISSAAFVAFLLVRQVTDHYRAVAIFVLTAGYLCNAGGHLLAGGYTSGLLIIQWLTVSLVLSVLFLTRNGVYLMIVLYLAIVLAAGFLEPWARGHAPELAPSFVATDATSTMVLMGLVVVGASLYLFDQVERYRQRADDLLLNILPGSIATRLKEAPGTIADGYNEVTVLFADIVDFTSMSSAADPVAVVNKLNEIFSDFDRLAMRHGLEKIKTIGDAYMVACGLPSPRADHCEAVAAFAVEMLEVMAGHRSWNGEPMALRIGINTGPVVAGVIGEQKFIYDLWGDAVNVASRMESSGLPGTIQVTEAVRRRLDGRYSFEARGPIVVKGKGEMVVYLMTEARGSAGARERET